MKFVCVYPFSPPHAHEARERHVISKCSLTAFHLSLNCPLLDCFDVSATIDSIESQLTTYDELLKGLKTIVGIGAFHEDQSTFYSDNDLISVVHHFDCLQR